MTARIRVTEETHPEHWDTIEYWKDEVCDHSDHIHRVQEWWLELVPIAVFGFSFDRSELFIWDDDYENQREAEILAWVNKCGGLLEATKIGPTIAVYDAGKWDKIDGWHRMRLAHFTRQSHVWCLVGYTEVSGVETCDTRQ